MSVWDLATIDAVRRLRTKYVVSDHLIALSRDGVLDAIARECFQELLDLAHVFAVEIDERDVEIVSQSREPDVAASTFVFAWRPGTLEVEFVGGPRDGELMAWHDAGGNLPLILPWLDVGVPFGEQEVSFTLYSVNYWLAGWSEEARRWVYSLRSGGRHG